MKKMNSDIILIDTEEELNKYLNICKFGDLNILYTTGICSITINPHSYELPHNSILQNNYNNSLLLIPEELINYLREELLKRKIEFHEVRFDRRSTNFNNSSNKKIIFVGDTKGLNKELYESKKQNEEGCIYYPKVRGNFKFRYNLRDLNKETMISREIKGLLEFDSKILVFTNQIGKRNLDYHKVLGILIKKDIPVIIDESREFKTIKKTDEKRLIKY